MHAPSESPAALQIKKQMGSPSGLCARRTASSSFFAIFGQNSASRQTPRERSSACFPSVQAAARPLDAVTQRGKLIMSEPIRHHYIPQFLLRNFSYDAGKRFVYYYDKKKKSLEEKQIRDVFIAKNLYRDEQNFPDSPTKTERTLAKYEGEVAPILQEKILAADEIRLTAEEDAKLKLFFAVIGFRSKGTCRFFEKNMTDAAKKMYRRYQKDGDYTDLWKRNLSHLAACRSIDEVQRHPEIDRAVQALFSARHGIYPRYAFCRGGERGIGVLHNRRYIPRRYKRIARSEALAAFVFRISSVSPQSPAARLRRRGEGSAICNEPARMRTPAAVPQFRNGHAPYAGQKALPLRNPSSER